MLWNMNDSAMYVIQSAKRWCVFRKRPKLWQRWKAAARGDSAFAGNRLLRGAAAVWEVIHPVLLLLLAAMALAGDSYNPFLYFQF